MEILVGTFFCFPRPTTEHMLESLGYNDPV